MIPPRIPHRMHGRELPLACRPAVSGDSSAPGGGLAKCAPGQPVSCFATHPRGSCTPPGPPWGLPGRRTPPVCHLARLKLRGSIPTPPPPLSHLQVHRVYLRERGKRALSLSKPAKQPMSPKHFHSDIFDFFPYYNKEVIAKNKRKLIFCCFCIGKWSAQLFS